MNEENKKSEDAIENEDMIDSVDSVTPKGLHVVNAVTALVSVSDVAGSKSFVGKLGTLWDMKNNIAKDFVEVIEGKFRRKNKLHAFFPEHTLDKAPGFFKRFVDGNLEFKRFCNEIVRLITMEANDIGSGRLPEANVIFVHYKRESEDDELGKFLVVMVRHKRGFEFNKDLQPKRLKRIDIDALLQAASVDLNLFDAVYPGQNGSAYLHFIQGRQNSDFFKGALGCSGAIPNKRSMAQLDQAIKDFICREKIPRKLRRALESAVDKYIDTVMSREDKDKRRVSLDEVVTAFEKALPVDHPSRKKLKEFINDNDYEVSDIFEPTPQAVKSTRKVDISDAGANFKCSFAPEAIGYEGENKPILLAKDGSYVKVLLNDSERLKLINSVGEYEQQP